ncbi:MAG: hypothetical protein Q4C48_05385 [Lachnospiraceae bacterium]|nr:hypothetical protein [Lachnospiraceae bacterium]
MEKRKAGAGAFAPAFFLKKREKSRFLRRFYDNVQENVWTEMAYFVKMQRADSTLGGEAAEHTKKKDTKEGTM